MADENFGWPRGFYSNVPPLDYGTGTPKMLGAIASPADPLQLRLTDFLVPNELPARREAFSNAATVNPWQMLGNDQKGDCVFAALVHWLMLQAKLAGITLTVTDAQVVAMYLQWTHGQDVGAVIRDVIKNLRTTSWFGQDKLLGFASIDPRDDEVTRIAIDLFGAAGRGILLPNSAVPQSSPSGRWKAPQNLSDPNNRPGSWGGHMTLDVGYNPDHLETVTWGYIQQVDDNFYPVYSMESYALVPNKRVPGFNYDKFAAALRQISHDVDIDPNPNPTPPPGPGPQPVPFDITQVSHDDFLKEFHRRFGRFKDIKIDIGFDSSDERWQGRFASY